MFDSKKPSEATLQVDDARKILEVVLDKSEMESNNVSLDVLVSKKYIRWRRFAPQLIVTGIMLVLCVLLPLLFVDADFEVKDAGAQGYTGSPSYEVYVDTVFPVSHIGARIQDSDMPVYKTGSRHYRIKPTMDGEMEVTVTLFNRQETTKTIVVDHSDSGDRTIEPVSQDK